MTTSHEIAVTTTGFASEAQQCLARDALRSQRRRLADLFREFDDDAWTAPTRCTERCVHEVVRHLCDVTLKWLALLRGESLAAVGLEAVDPRTTPLEWLERSTDERPADTLIVFEHESANLLGEVDSLIERAATNQIQFPYGTVTWSIVPMHAFWDAWVHERDILCPFGRAHESTEIESRAAAMYGMVLSCVASTLGGTALDETVELSGDGGGTFRLEALDRTIKVSLIEETGGGEALYGALPDVVDSLVGRGPELGEVLSGQLERVERLATLRRFMLSPTQRMPT